NLATISAVALSQRSSDLGYYSGVFFVSAILFLLLLFSGPQKGPALSELPRWQLIGGLLGPIYVVVLTLATPHIGIAMTMIAILSGQVGKSVLIDHFGWFGAARKRVNGERWIALALIVVALVLIARG
ncbi:DMT family transporter, partial [Cellulomonas fimi]|nr:DMT family transporter [Cellulomonas fimi]